MPVNAGVAEVLVESFAAVGGESSAFLKEVNID